MFPPTTYWCEGCERHTDIKKKSTHNWSNSKRLDPVFTVGVVRREGKMEHIISPPQSSTYENIQTLKASRGFTHLQYFKTGCLQVPRVGITGALQLVSADSAHQWNLQPSRTLVHKPNLWCHLDYYDRTEAYHPV